MYSDECGFVFAEPNTVFGDSAKRSVKLSLLEDDAEELIASPKSDSESTPIKLEDNSELLK